MLILKRLGRMGTVPVLPIPEKPSLVLSTLLLYDLRLTTVLSTLLKYDLRLTPTALIVLELILLEKTRFLPTLHEV